MLSDIIFLLLGLALLVVGGNFVTDGSVAIARRLGVSGLVVGLTVVALGSSAPDLAVCVMSTVHHKTELAMGDIVGACIFDLLLAVGICAWVRPVKISSTLLRSDMPLLTLAALILWICADNRLIDGWNINLLTRSDGLLMLMLFGTFMVLTYKLTKTATHDGTTAPAPQPAPGMKPWLAVTAIVGGLGALVIGGEWIVRGASGIAIMAGWSETLVGLTIVAVGSSLPDLATSLIAAIKNQPGIALGNLFGSCIFDILFVLGTSSLIHPLNADNITSVDFIYVFGAAVLVWVLALRNRTHTITRGAGIVLTLLYGSYITYLVLTA